MATGKARLPWIGVAVVLAVLVAIGFWWYSPTQRRHRLNQTLFAACETGDVGAIRSALSAGADVNARDGDGITPLMYAAKGERPDMADPAVTDHPDALRVLLTSGADANAATDSGFVALFWAARYGHVGAAEALIENGASVDAKDKQGTTALRWATTNRGASPPTYDRVIAVLKEAGAKE